MLHFIVLHRCFIFFYKLKAGPSTAKKILSCLIAILAFARFLLYCGGVERNPPGLRGCLNLVHKYIQEQLLLLCAVFPLQQVTTGCWLDARAGLWVHLSGGYGKNGKYRVLFFFFFWAVQVVDFGRNAPNDTIAFSTYLAVITKWNLVYSALCDSQPSPSYKKDIMV